MRTSTSALRQEVPNDPGLYGRWDPNIIDGVIPAVSVALMRDGRVLYWSGYEASHHPDDGTLAYYLDLEFITGHPHEADTRIINLTSSNGSIHTPRNPKGARPGDLFCSAHTILSDGRILAAGGTDWSPVLLDGSLVFFYGLVYAQLFDPGDPGWVATADMAAQRWYPSLITLPSGDAFVASGLVVAGTSTMQTLLERYRVATGTWEPVGHNSFPMYPRLVVVPSGPLKGKVYYSTNGLLWAPSGFDAREATWNLQQACDVDQGSCRLLGPSILGARQNGASVLLPLSAAEGYHARVLTFGGTLQRTALATPSAELADLATDPPTNQLAAPLGVGRWMPNAVLLPDGTVLAVGGALMDNVTVSGQPSVYVMNAELYDPATNTWKLLAPMQVPRGYHGTALLLPDGRVLVGGHVTVPFPSTLVRDTIPPEQQIVEKRLEIFEPPYLFRGPRPKIVSAPESVGYGAQFNITTSSASAIESVVLVRPGANTHSYDSDQRVIRLLFTDAGGGDLTVTAPPDGAVAPPGYYMLFVNRSTPAGPVPSKARFVRIH